MTDSRESGGGDAEDRNSGGRRYVPAVSPRQRWLLLAVLTLLSLIAINSVYLVGVRLVEWSSGKTIQNYFYQSMFLMHLVLGLALIPLVLSFGALHGLSARKRPNRRAVRAGVALFSTSVILIVAGLLVTRIDGMIQLRDPALRNVAYWIHALSPLAIVWLFVLHRLAGRRIRWVVGGRLAAVAGVTAVALIGLHAQDPRNWGEPGPEASERYFFPSLARTASGKFIPARALLIDDYCAECHESIHDRWSKSAHRFSSFNNPAYLFSVRNTRKTVLARDGDTQAARFCAGCHDPVPFFGGEFDRMDIELSDVSDASSQAGITCTACHAISHVNSPRGNADYTIEEPIHYPFAFSENAALRWVNRQLIKANPGFHKKTFLKPLHRSTEFCGTCHKVHLPEELNGYKFLRGQNHYDAFLLSGVSGHGASSFYYPPRAEPNCNGCHMPLQASTDFAADFFDDSGVLKVHDHLFPSANTAIPHLVGLGSEVVDAHRAFLEGVMRVDIFGIRRGGTLDGELMAPLRPALPALAPGEPYLLEVVIRTLKMGHTFTEGTADSNEVWLEVVLSSGGRVIGRSGGLGEYGRLDPWAHRVNSYVLDREGNRIDRRNAEAIFTALYNHQIPPGAADTVQYRFELPEDAAGHLDVEVRLHYRKFDTTYMQHIYGADRRNDLPIVTLASDRVRLPIGGAAADTEEPDFPSWMRWNDYGIGLLRKGAKGSQKGELRQAEAAFRQVESLGRADGPLNLARVYFKEGRLDDAVGALERAGAFSPAAPPWTVAWFTGLVNKQNGHLDAAIESFESIVDTRFQEARDRGFDFGKDYRVLNQLGLTLFERSKLERGESRARERESYLRAAAARFESALEIDPENVTAHYGLAQVYARLGDAAREAEHRGLHARFKPDDSAGYVINLHRRQNPAANHAAEPIVVYDLQRPGAYTGSVEQIAREGRPHVSVRGRK
ncbi:MAG: tetratricopeptide repeat protein [Deltaproteobacteria bacterium]|nr:tetratricopeptide repeat protein [Deltaproteobacteria bacterium]